MDLELYEEIVRRMKQRRPAVLATVVESGGSTPRKAGAKMLVDGEGLQLGTVGGGPAEVEVVELAREILQGGAPRLHTVSLTEDSGYVCGGRMTFYLEPLVSASRLFVVGPGHVGRAVAEAARAAGFDATLLEVTADCSVFDDVPVGPEDFVFIAARDHELDFQAAVEALGTDARYIGVLGSRRKRVALEKWLTTQGMPPEQVDRIVSPAGLEIGAETPEEIAVSVVGQMIQVRRGS